jgi:TP901 family phage tail tape measure protein
MASTIDVVKDFDDALTEFKKVSDLSGQALNDYAKQLGELGSTVARSTTEMVQGASAFRKMGFSDEDSAKLAQTNAMFQNIADSEMSAGESAKILIGTMKGFGYNVDQMQDIVDVINEVSNSFSISSTDISDGLANVSAVASTAGNSLEETTAMLTGMVEITQSAGKSSRGLRQIIARLTQTLDDSSSTGKKLKQIYSDLGISIKDEQGNLRSTYDVLDELSTKWDALSTNQKQYIALTSAGANQWQNFTALMNNWGHVIDANNKALGSSGSAMRENERYMESLSA